MSSLPSQNSPHLTLSIDRRGKQGLERRKDVTTEVEQETLVFHSKQNVFSHDPSKVLGQLRNLGRNWDDELKLEVWGDGRGKTWPLLILPKTSWGQRRRDRVDQKFEEATLDKYKEGCSKAI